MINANGKQRTKTTCNSKYVPIMAPRMPAPTKREITLNVNLFHHSSNENPAVVLPVFRFFQGEKSVLKSGPTEKKCGINMNKLVLAIKKFRFFWAANEAKFLFITSF